MRQKSSRRIRIAQAVAFWNTRNTLIRERLPFSNQTWDLSAIMVFAIPIERSRLRSDKLSQKYPHNNISTLTDGII